MTHGLLLKDTPTTFTFLARTDQRYQRLFYYFGER